MHNPIRISVPPSFRSCSCTGSKGGREEGRGPQEGGTQEGGAGGEEEKGDHRRGRSTRRTTTARRRGQKPSVTMVYPRATMVHPRGRGYMLDRGRGRGARGTKVEGMTAMDDYDRWPAA